MANTVREFVVESLRGFYERLPLKKIAVDGSVLTPDASGIVNISGGAGGNVTESTVASWGFTKNEGTLTGVTMNGESQGTTGVVDLGNVVTGNAKIFYGTCATAAATVSKVVTCAAFTAADLVKGALIFVTFSSTNSGAVADLTLNVNSTGPKFIKKIYNASSTANLNSVGELRADRTYLFGYDGTYWVCMTLDYNAYSSMSQSEINAGTGTSGRVLTPKMLRANFYTETEVNSLLDAKADSSTAIGSLSLGINSSNYQITLSGTKVDGTPFTVDNVIDLPLESVVVDGSYNNTTKKVVLTLQSGSTVEFSVADLVAGLQSEITSTNKLSADLIQDGTTNKTVTATEKSTWNGKQNAISDLDTIRANASAGAAKMGLPTTTSADEGKMLMVVNGAWSMVTPVSIYSGSSTPDNTQGVNGDIYLQV